MRVLVATQQGQGDRDDDFFDALEGELVHLPIEPCVDHLCNCQDAATGLSTSKGTTTFAAVQGPAIKPDEYAEMLVDALDREGWLERFEAGRLTAWVQKHVDLAAEVPQGGILRAWFDRCADHDH